MDSEEQTPLLKIWLDSVRIVFTKVSRYVALTVMWSLLQAVLVQFLWNFTIPVIVQFSSAISYPQALALIFLARILSRTWTKDSQTELMLMQLRHQQYIDNTTYGMLGIMASQYEATQSPPSSVAPPVDKGALN